MKKVDLKPITRLLQSRLDIACALVYGSYTTPKTLHAESDLDIAILFKTHAKDHVNALLKLTADLSELSYPTKVDIVDLDTIDPILGYQVLKSHKVLFDPEHQIPTRLSELLVQYLDFKITRKVIEKNIGKKRFYG